MISRRDIMVLMMQTAVVVVMGTVVVKTEVKGELVVVIAAKFLTR
jgi:hypothetical protein